MGAGAFIMAEITGIHNIPKLRIAADYSGEFGISLGVLQWWTFEPPKPVCGGMRDKMIAKLRKLIKGSGIFRPINILNRGRLLCAYRLIVAGTF